MYRKWFRLLARFEYLLVVRKWTINWWTSQNNGIQSFYFTIMKIMKMILQKIFQLIQTYVMNRLVIFYIYDKNMYIKYLIVETFKAFKKYCIILNSLKIIKNRTEHLCGPCILKLMQTIFILHKIRSLIVTSPRFLKNNVTLFLFLKSNNNWWFLIFGVPTCLKCPCVY